MSALDGQLHKLWGQAKEQVYDKPAWIEMQAMLQDWAENPTWFADRLLALWPFLQAATHAELLEKLQEKMPKVHAIIAERLEWKPFTENFDYAKKFYDVLLPSGTVIEQCWPNAGFMNPINQGGQFSPKDNIKVRLSLRHPMDDE